MNESQIVPYTSVRHLVRGAALVLAPHPDDEVLGCGGAILRHIAAGEPVDVVFLTDGSAATGAVGFKGDYVRMRQDEARAAARILGYGDPVFLDHKDRSLRHGEELVALISSLIASHSPRVVYAPSIYEVHPDHRALALSAIEAVRRHGGDLHLASYEIGNPQMPNRLLDVTDLVDQLKKTMQCYPSQLAERRYDSFVLDGLNKFRAYTLGPGIESVEAYWMATGSELREHRPRFYDTLMQSWSNAGIDAYGLPEAGLEDAGPTPLVSVITRTIGRDTLQETLDSILTQSWSNIESVLVTAAPDGKRSAETGGFWRFPQRCVGGETALARPEAGNLGMANARGEFFLFLDDDDTIDPSHIATLAEILIANPEAIAAYAGVRVRDQRDPDAPDIAIFHSKSDIRQLVYDNFLPIHGVLFRRRAFDNGCRMDPKLPLYEDWDFWLQVAEIGPFLRAASVSATYYSCGGSGAGAVTYDPAATKAARNAVYEKWLKRWTPEQIDHIFGLNRSILAEREALSEQIELLQSAQATSGTADANVPITGSAKPPASQSGRGGLRHGLGPTDSLKAAQSRAHDRIIEMIPPHSRILNVGAGTGMLLSEFLSREYDAIGLETDPVLRANADPAVSGMQFLDCAYADFQYDGLFDAIVFHDTAQDLNLLTILDRAMTLLRIGGQIIIMDEFALTRKSWSPEPLHLLATLRALAERLGFTVTVDEDLTDLVRPPLTENDDKIRGYRLVALRRDHVPEWRIRPVEAVDYPQFAALFRETFNDNMSRKHWEWKYAPGNGENIGIWHDGQLIAHYGGISRSAMAFGTPTLLALPSDIMARKGAHKGISRASAFLNAGATLQELHAGLGSRHLIAAGFPNRRSGGRAPRRIGLHGEPTDRVLEARWSSKELSDPVISTPVTSDNAPKFAPVVDKLWLAMSEDLSDRVVAIRNWAVFQRRFAEHPDRTYRSYLLNDPGGDAFGLIVLRLQGERMELLDLVGRLDDMPRMVEAARDIAARAGAKSLWGWFTEHCALPYMKSDDVTLHDLGVESPSFTWMPGLPLEKLKHKIWLTAADADFH